MFLLYIGFRIMITKEDIEKEATELYLKIPCSAWKDDTWEKCIQTVLEKYIKLFNIIL
jgi:hypothetical protein